MQAVPVKDGVWWVGALDPHLRIFDIVMETRHGTTYNSYLVRGRSKTALIETVKYGFEGELLQRVASVVDPATVDYIVLNHTEPDHSGGLGRVLEAMPGARVYASRAALKFLAEIVNRGFDAAEARDGEILDLGGLTLRFIAAPFLHWPDSMFTYLAEERVLFSCDVFGCHYWDGHLFNDEAGDFGEAYRYYYDVIFSPFKKYVLEAVEKIRPLEIDVICHSHGPILRHNPRYHVGLYEEWSRKAPPEPRKKVLLAYASAYGYTRSLAEAIAEGIREAGVEADLVDAGITPPGAIMHRVESADGLLVGSPTINRDAVPPIWEMLAYVSPLVNRGKPAAAFGSYGWSGEAVKFIEQRLEALQFRVVRPGLRVNLQPSAAALEEAREFGRRFAAAVLGVGERA
ncbi:MAG: FprA family A-type flavoprotein [Desulfotomaculales bacterium]